MALISKLDNFDFRYKPRYDQSASRVNSTTAKTPLRFSSYYVLILYFFCLFTFTASCSKQRYQLSVCISSFKWHTFICLYCGFKCLVLIVMVNCLQQCLITWNGMLPTEQLHSHIHSLAHECTYRSAPIEMNHKRKTAAMLLSQLQHKRKSVCFCATNV